METKGHITDLQRSVHIFDFLVLLYAIPSLNKNKLFSKLERDDLHAKKKSLSQKKGEEL